MNDTPSMTNEQLTTTLRYFLTTLGAYAAGKGWVTPQQITELTPLILPVLALLYGLYTNWRKEKQTQARETVALNVGAAAQADPMVPMSAPGNISAPEAKALLGALSPAVASVVPQT